jgi:Protein of unknown function (DUF1173)
MTPRYLFREYQSTPDAPNWQQVLGRAHAAKVRGECLCRGPGGQRPQLYVARVPEGFAIKRMPFTGPEHAASCEHYSAPPELSGFGQVDGAAIRDDVDAGTTTLSLAFPLSKGAARTVTAPGEAVEHESVRSDGTKLTLRALLHYLYDEAGLTRWTPAMNQRRSWGVVRREILKAATSKKTKGFDLAEVLFMPEPWRDTDVQGIQARHTERLSRLAKVRGARMIVIAPFKDLETARFGKQLRLKHLPEHPLLAADDLADALASRFKQQIELASNYQNSHLLFAGTISRSGSGVFNMETGMLANVNHNWLPFETTAEHELLEALMPTRRFVKGLRYNLSHSKPLASVVLQDTAPHETALYVAHADSSADYTAELAALMESSPLASWRWDADVAGMPALPPSKNEPNEATEHE